MEFQILGTLQVCDAEGAVRVGGGKQRALLAILLVQPNRPVSEDVLIEALWGEDATARSSGNLHVLVSRLRHTLGADRLLREGSGYVIRVDDDELDAATFERLRGEGKPREALALWRGPPLADFTYDVWAQNEIRRFEELRLLTLEERIEADLAAGGHAEVIGELQALVAEHPLRETLRRLLILALYRSGRQAEALDEYRAARRMLDEELGLEPSPALRELEGAVLRHDPSLEQPNRPVAAGPVRRRSHAAALAAAGLAIAAGFAAAIGVITLLDGDSEPFAAAAATTTNEPAEAKQQPPPQPTTRVIVRERTRPAPPPPKTRPSAQAPAPPPPIAPPPPPPPPPRPPSPAPAPKEKAKPKPKVPSQPVPAVTPTRIADNFDGGALDGDLWQQALVGSGASVGQANGRLEIELRPEATGGPPEFAGQVLLECTLPGDFDVRVDYQLLDWPAENGVTVHLAAVWERTAVDIARQSFSSGENYGTWFTRGTGTARPTTHMRGTIRILREDWYASTYYLTGRGWKRLGSFFTGGAPKILLKASSNEAWFGDKLVRVAFDNFTLVAERPAC